MLEVLRQRAELLMERRRQDVKDEAEEVNSELAACFLFSPPLIPSTHPLSSSSSPPLIPPPPPPLLTAPRHDMAIMQQQARQMRAVEREGRRRRRRAKGLNGHQSGSVASTHYEGLSSDDELLETNRLKFISDIGKICGHWVGLRACESFGSVCP